MGKKLSGFTELAQTLETLTDEERIQFTQQLLRSNHWGKGNQPKFGEINKDLEKFFNKKMIEVLSFDNNRNYKVTTSSGESFVIKIENRLGLTESPAVEHLKSGPLSDVFLQESQKYSISYTEGGRDKVRILSCTPFYGMDVAKYNALSHESQSTQTQIKSAINVYSQMAAILKIVSDEHCAFTDAKNSNWLIDPKTGKLAITDTKGFISTPEGMISQQVVTSDAISPPESRKLPYSTDKMQAYALGRNLYQGLKGLTNLEIKNLPHDESVYDFKDAIFQSEEGAELAALIQDLTKTDPNQRCSLEEAVERLNAMQEKYVATTEMSAESSSQGAKKQGNMMDRFKSVCSNIRDTIKPKSEATFFTATSGDPDESEPRNNNPE